MTPYPQSCRVRPPGGDSVPSITVGHSIGINLRVFPLHALSNFDVAISEPVYAHGLTVEHEITDGATNGRRDFSEQRLVRGISWGGNPRFGTPSAPPP